MTEATAGTLPGRITPPRTFAGGGGTTPAPAPSEVVPAEAGAPVWQPWVGVLGSAQSRLKTEIQASLRTFEREAGDAGRILDAARAMAAQATAPLEAAAWTAWHRYMNEAAAISEAIMTPALAAHGQALAAAHDKLRRDLTPAEHGYAQTLSDAQWTQSLANNASVTL